MLIVSVVVAVAPALLDIPVQPLPELLARPVELRVVADQHFTEPPPRYSEASLVKRLEELGIGRPSTYAATLATLRDREYVRIEKKRLVPEDKGMLVTAFLESFFKRYVEFDFTANLEEQLDDISGGRFLLGLGTGGDVWLPPYGSAWLHQANALQ